MIVWGGTNQTIYLNTGGRYNPKTDSWTPTGLVNAPLGRIAHTAIWSGTEMGIWGGVDSTFNDTNTAVDTIRLAIVGRLSAPGMRSLPGILTPQYGPGAK